MSTLAGLPEALTKLTTTLTEICQLCEVDGVKLGLKVNKSDDASDSDDSTPNAIATPQSEVEAEKTPDTEQEEEKKAPEPQKCAVKAYEARYDSKGERELVALNAEKAEKEDVDTDDEKKQYALCSYKWYTKDGEIETASVEIMSPQIITALQKVINEYPNEHFWSESVTIDSPYRPVFHYRDQLAAYVANTEDEVVKSHVQLLLTFCEKENRREINEYEANVLNAIETPSIRWKNLWMVYKPGSLLFNSKGPSLMCMEVVDAQQRGGNCPAYVITGKKFTHDGEHYGYQEMQIAQAPYKGMKSLVKLKAIPEAYYEDAEKAKTLLLERGKKFRLLKGSHYRSYNGTVSALSRVRDWESCGEYKEEPMIISSRIMIDSRMFSITMSPNKIYLSDEKTIPKDCDPEDEGEYITDRDLLIADHKVPGYALQVKRWCWFNVDAVEPVVFNKDAFDSLLLPKKHKTLVHSLVKSHVSGNDEFDDLIAGKGKGLVFVLHGCPGVGKTFTAESVADHIERPLYILNSGELGIDPTQVEENLDKALMLAVAWNAILLIDEADVFLEERSMLDLQRNCLVSLFLRTLEYYEGILFLTTNRVKTFDPAFKSRVHLALKYSALNVQARKELWIAFIKRTSKNPPVLSKEALDRLSIIDVNGRQIKNAVRTASALARDEGVQLNESHLTLVLDTVAEFERDLGEGDEWSTNGYYI
ncbi:hypothetical protein ES702_00246 [subsurface metagenome]